MWVGFGINTWMGKLCVLKVSLFGIKGSKVSIGKGEGWNVIHNKMNINRL